MQWALKAACSSVFSSLLLLRLPCLDLRRLQNSWNRQVTVIGQAEGSTDRVGGYKPTDVRSVLHDDIAGHGRVSFNTHLFVHGDHPREVSPRETANMNIPIGDEEEILGPGLKERAIRDGGSARHHARRSDINGPFRDECRNPGRLGGADTHRNRDIRLEIERPVDWTVTAQRPGLRRYCRAEAPAIPRAAGQWLGKSCLVIDVAIPA